MEMVNGYVFLDLTKSNVYAKALKVLGADKPVVIKDGSGAPYFVDSLTLSGTSVVITKGGKTITIANDNTITSEGENQYHRYIVNMVLNDSADGTGDDFNLFFQITTNYELPLFNNETLTTEKANLIKNYQGIIAIDDNGETIQGFNDDHFSEGNPFSFRPVGDLYIVTNSKITINKIY